MRDCQIKPNLEGDTEDRDKRGGGPSSRNALPSNIAALRLDRRGMEKLVAANKKPDVSVVFVRRQIEEQNPRSTAHSNGLWLRCRYALISVTRCAARTALRVTEFVRRFSFINPDSGTASHLLCRLAGNECGGSDFHAKP